MRAWLLATLALYPLLAITRPLRHRARKRCMSCGYPRAAGAGVCSECGLDVGSAGARARRRALIHCAVAALLALLVGGLNSALPWVETRLPPAIQIQLLTPQTDRLWRAVAARNHGELERHAAELAGRAEEAIRCSPDASLAIRCLDLAASLHNDDPDRLRRLLAACIASPHREVLCRAATTLPIETLAPQDLSNLRNRLEQALASGLADLQWMESLRALDLIEAESRRRSGAEPVPGCVGWLHGATEPAVIAAFTVTGRTDECAMAAVRLATLCPARSGPHLENLVDACRNRGRPVRAVLLSSWPQLLPDGPRSGEVLLHWIASDADNGPLAADRIGRHLTRYSDLLDRAERLLATELPAPTRSVLAARVDWTRRMQAIRSDIGWRQPAP